MQERGRIVAKLMFDGVSLRSETKEMMKNDKNSQEKTKLAALSSKETEEGTQENQLLLLLVMRTITMTQGMRELITIFEDLRPLLFVAALILFLFWLLIRFTLMLANCAGQDHEELRETDL